ncbi:uncharacterized protein J3D65DRAFT_599023 [Phyllosticta citribraziliensis]|uniref:Uncharacterized protein n=1 Tax=Phyllosticta citribraziliensis TaxID=989973 RepID=A0ABR1M917_9PEZI
MLEQRRVCGGGWGVGPVTAYPSLPVHHVYGPDSTARGGVAVVEKPLQKHEQLAIQADRADDEPSPVAMVLQTEHMVEIQFYGRTLVQGPASDAQGYQDPDQDQGPPAIIPHQTILSSCRSAAEIRNKNQHSSVNTLPHAAMSRSRPGPLPTLVVGRLVSCRGRGRVVGGSVGRRARHGRRLIFSLSIRCRSMQSGQLSLQPLPFSPAVITEWPEEQSRDVKPLPLPLRLPPSVDIQVPSLDLDLNLHLMGTCTTTKIAAASAGYPPVLCCASFKPSGSPSLLSLRRLSKLKLCCRYRTSLFL